MGLPIWRDPEENKSTKDSSKADPTAAARSSIRRRPSIHGRRSSRPRLIRDATVHSPRARYTYLRDSNSSSTRSGVPPVSTLLESADRHGHAPPPPPVPESRNYYTHRESSSFLRDRPSSGGQAALQETANRLERQTSAMRDRLLQRRMERDMRRVRASRGAEDLSSRLVSTALPLPVPQPAAATGTDRARHPSLPTPPLDTFDTEGDSLFVPDTRAGSGRGAHPLRNSWSPASPVDGLGDRDRSPTPADHWEIMRSTITPDATLPSADSSFTSAAASQSFGSAHAETTTDPEHTSSSSNSQRNTSDDGASESASSVDPGDLICDDENEHLAGAENMAEFMYEYEEGTSEGRQRIAEMRELRDREGNRFALAHESARIDIGFRLIEYALETEEGRDRLIEVGVLAHSGNPDEPLILQDPEEPRRRRLSFSRSRRPRIMDDEAPTPNPAQYGDGPRAAAQAASAQVHNYFGRYAADALHAHSRSPPPRYEPLASHPDVEVFTSRDEPQPQPVSPPTPRSRVDTADAMVSGDEANLDAMRRVVERLSRRHDVPDEWWSSIGLNLSRTRAEARSPERAEPRTETAAGGRVRSGRVERRHPRL